MGGLHWFHVAVMLAAYVAATQGRYLIQNDFSGSGFFDNFDFWTANDPTNGYVDYVSRADAEGPPTVLN
jgi:hypothetical protein